MRDRSPIQSVALLVGIVFLVVGILGFIPGMTSNYDDLQFAGHDSNAQLLGIFDTSILHDIVHLLFGVAAITLAKTLDGARTFLVGGGVIYLVLFLYGAIWHGEAGSNWFPVNWADNILHLALGAGMIVAGVVLGKEAVRRDTRPRPRPASHRSTGLRGGRAIPPSVVHAPHQKDAATTT